jgi:hypothetical protein
MRRTLSLLVLGGMVGACGGGEGDSPDAATTDAPPGVARTLITAHYELEPGDEYYICERITLDEDLLVTQFKPIDGPGTHHTILAIDPSPKGPGQTRCGPIDNRWQVLFASGVASPPLDMPPGVAFRLEAGQEVVFNMHLYNATDSVIAASSRIEVTSVGPGQFEHEAEVIFAGPLSFSIPVGATDHKVTGACSMNGNANFFAVFPHMHQYGTGIRVWAENDDGQHLVYDVDDYDFEHQDFATFTPIPMKQGDKIRVECTYSNPTDEPITFGDSSDEEMCFAISYRYPKIGTSSITGVFCPF